MILHNMLQSCRDWRLHKHARKGTMPHPRSSPIRSVVAALEIGMSEQWKPVVGYEGIYEVSDTGRVRSLSRMINSETRGVYWMAGRIRRLAPRRDGYVGVMLFLDGSYKQPKVHDLVLTAFVGPRPSGYEADHMNYDRSDNRLCNLRWVSPENNRAHSRGRFLSAAATLSQESAEEIRRRAAAGKMQVSLAKEYGVSRATVCKIIARKSWKGTP